MKPFWRDLDTRTGWLSAAKKFGEKPTPARGGWWFTLGSIVLTALLVQVVTGILLATAYAPTPDHARASVWWIEHRVPSGGFVRALHVWGASAIVVFAALHLARVLYHGAYKDPRRENWWIGLLSLGIILALAFTGYLLPWDQKGYWATVVGLKIASQPPVVGPLAARALGGAGGVGASTLTRFAALHTIVLPAALVVLVLVHMVLLRRHGHAGIPSDTTPREPFYPKQMARDAAAALLFFAVLLVVAHFFPARLEVTADPSDTSYVPRPEWYFLSLFQLLHYFSGKAIIVGTAGIPLVVAAFLFGLPLLDRKPNRRPESRRGWIGAGALLAAGVVLLTAIAAMEEPTSGIPASEPPPPPLAFTSADLKNYDLSPFSPAVARGGTLIAGKRCLECHLINGDGNPKGLELKHEARRRTRAWLIAHFKDPQELSPHSKMPPYDDLSERELDDMAEYLLALP